MPTSMVNLYAVTEKFSPNTIRDATNNSQVAVGIKSGLPTPSSEFTALNNEPWVFWNQAVITTLTFFGQQCASPDQQFVTAWTPYNSQTLHVLVMNSYAVQRLTDSVLINTLLTTITQSTEEEDKSHMLLDKPSRIIQRKTPGYHLERMKKSGSKRD